jgi:hypothetical protein
MNEITTKLNIIDELVSENKMLKEKICNLEERVTHLESKGPDRSISQMDSLANETEDRIRRKHNIIICNVQESLHEERDNILRDDQSRIFNILKEADGTLSHGDLKCFRLGKMFNNKPRPVKVVFKQPNHASEIFKNMSKLPQNCKVYRDQTVLQRNHFMKLKEELHARVQNGEKNLMIKYIRGTPKIVNSSKNFSVTIKTSAG